MQCIVLDAMGVIYTAADDVNELLIPFIEREGGNADPQLIQSAYDEASVGMISSDELWHRASLSPEVENRYLEHHTLVPGVMDFLQAAKQKNVPVWCLSNDIGRWSRKLREMFHIEELLAGAIISGDVRARKPNPAIYRCLLDCMKIPAEELLFFDDREKNVQAAIGMGIQARQFLPNSSYKVLMKLLA
jgi:HAD superfamily hydrolase (TIGR01509 family)